MANEPPIVHDRVWARFEQQERRFDRPCTSVAESYAFVPWPDVPGMCWRCGFMIEAHRD